MENQQEPLVFASAAHRAVHTFQRGLAQLPPGATTAQQQLHAFFSTWYQAMAEAPADFGLPLSPDIFIALDESNVKDRKQQAARALKKPYEIITQTLQFLQNAAIAGQCADDALLLPANLFTQFLGKSRPLAAMRAGLARLGLMILPQENQCVKIHHQRQPLVMTALKALASACAAHPHANVGAFCFARCDLNVLTPGYEPTPEALYQIFAPQDAARVLELHAYFSERGYKAAVFIGGQFDWVVKYQGNRKIKASPLFQVEYQMRYQNPLIVQFKFASANRIIPLLSSQPFEVQEDFSRRVFPCNGEACGWCKNRPNLNPSMLEFNGEKRQVCWFSNSEFRGLQQNSLGLIKQYEQMHQQLA